MKKCRKCGALQSDERTLCIDCGALLGDAMNAAEEKQAQDTLSDTLTGMADRTEPFHVTPRDRLLGIVSFAAAAVLLLAVTVLASFVKSAREDMPQGVLVESGDGLVTVIGSGEEGDVAEAERILRETEQLENTALIAVPAIALLINAAVMFLFPKFSWRIGSFRHRLYSADPDVPSETYLAFEKIIRHASFLLGCAAAAVMLCRLFLLILL